ncbi:unnamed protein product [Prunus armeniaca]|uniref:Uncharacterized protein n=1 Tax=Prunus armeniaca TaxID=36596 RepID=A0A6J5VD96_PRUAR|nr:unnamed protein product [Prunus armeniaca]
MVYNHLSWHEMTYFTWHETCKEFILNSLWSLTFRKASQGKSDKRLRRTLAISGPTYISHEPSPSGVERKETKRLGFGLILITLGWYGGTRWTRLGHPKSFCSPYQPTILRHAIPRRRWLHTLR